MQKFIRDVLKEKVQEVKFSDRLVSSPAIVTSIITPHMRKMMKSLMAGKASLVVLSSASPVIHLRNVGQENDGLGNIPMTLELSPKHHIVTTLHAIQKTNEPVARIAVEQLYDNACIAAGTLDDPRVLMSRLNKVLEMFVYQGAGYDYAKGEYRISDTAESAESSKAEEVKAEDASSGPSSSTPSSSTSKFEEVKPSQ
eukprot:symbB.v1.2.017871.t1/scaffold1334.1/size124731/5